MDLNFVWKTQLARTKNTPQSIIFEDRHVIQESTLNNRSTTHFQDKHITLHASTACMLCEERIS